MSVTMTCGIPCITHGTELEANLTLQFASLLCSVLQKLQAQTERDGIVTCIARKSEVLSVSDTA